MLIRVLRKQKNFIREEKWICTSMGETASCKRHEGRKEVSPSPTTPDGKWVPQETRKQARMIFMATRPTITAAEWSQKQNRAEQPSKSHFVLLQLNYTNEVPTFVLRNFSFFAFYIYHIFRVTVFTQEQIRTASAVAAMMTRSDCVHIAQFEKDHSGAFLSASKAHRASIYLYFSFHPQKSLEIKQFQ